MNAAVDLNCDLGEGFGLYRMGHDAALLDVATSANIACGVHAGDPSIMQRTVQTAIERGVAIGAHPSLPDLQGFGRREMKITPAEAYALVLYQVGALYAFASAQGARLHHVKPHGALYNMAAADAALAAAIAKAVHDFDRSLWLYGLAGSALIAAGEAVGLNVASEAFVDRGYRNDGTLVPRSLPGALIEDEHAAIARALVMVTSGRVLSNSGAAVNIRADTLCIHGDTAGAVDMAKALKSALEAKGVTVRAP